MAQQLRLNPLKDGILPLGPFSPGEIIVGRDPDEGGVVVDSEVVSRNHCLFAYFGRHWLFQDLGSTNGSWIDGRRCQEGHWCLIRRGSAVQLADLAFSADLLDDPTGGFTLGAEGPNRPRPRTLLLFKAGSYMREFSVPEYGRALVIGGHGADAEIEGALIELPSLVVERRGIDVTATNVAQQLVVYLNGEPLNVPSVLADGDELEVSGYAVLYNNPTPVKGTEHRVAQELREDGTSPAVEFEESVCEPSNRPSELMDWSNEPARALNPVEEARLGKSWEEKIPQKPIFGQRIDNDSGIHETVAVPAGSLQPQMGGYDRHPASRFAEQDTAPKPRFSSVEDRVIIFLLGIVLLGVMGFVAWFLLS